MDLSKTIWDNPAQFLAAQHPQDPILFFSPETLQANTRRFIKSFPGTVTYAVKANPAPVVLSNLLNAGISAFDVASPKEMDQVRLIAPTAILHYNNPVRSMAEITHAVKMNVKSYSVDAISEFKKLVEKVPPKDTEISVRFKLPISGAAYDFGAKFGLEPAAAITLLKQVKQSGFTPSLTFHPGTQCTTAGVWKAYIEMAAHISKEANVPINRLNVGGGFPSHRLHKVAPNYQNIFDEIFHATNQAFGDTPPKLICEPGRAIVADAFCLASLVKAIRDGKDVFLNEGVYGALSEYLVVGAVDRLEVLSPTGAQRTAPTTPKQIFGPTCDSIDKLYDQCPLPSNMAEGDYIIFQGLGAYSTTLATKFNGYGLEGITNIAHLTG